MGNAYKRSFGEDFIAGLGATLPAGVTNSFTNLINLQSTLAQREFNQTIAQSQLGISQAQLLNSLDAADARDTERKGVIEKQIGPSGIIPAPLQKELDSINARLSRNGGIRQALSGAGGAAVNPASPQQTTDTTPVNPNQQIPTSTQTVVPAPTGDQLYSSTDSLVNIPGSNVSGSPEVKDVNGQMSVIPIQDQARDLFGRQGLSFEFDKMPALYQQRYIDRLDSIKGYKTPSAQKDVSIKALQFEKFEDFQKSIQENVPTREELTNLAAGVASKKYYDSLVELFLTEPGFTGKKNVPIFGKSSTTKILRTLGLGDRQVQVAGLAENLKKQAIDAVLRNFPTVGGAALSPQEIESKVSFLGDFTLPPKDVARLLTTQGPIIDQFIKTEQAKLIGAKKDIGEFTDFDPSVNQSLNDPDVLASLKREPGATTPLDKETQFFYNKLQQRFAGGVPSSSDLGQEVMSTDSTSTSSPSPEGAPAGTFSPMKLPSGLNIKTPEQRDKVFLFKLNQAVTEGLITEDEAQQRATQAGIKFAPYSPNPGSPDVNLNPHSAPMLGDPSMIPDMTSMSGLPAMDTLQQPFSFGQQNIKPEFNNFKSVLKQYLFGVKPEDEGVFETTGYDANGRPIQQRIGDIRR